MDQAEIEIPQYFLCPISLQIMRDPVTTVTGITYDRESIENWLISTDTSVTCPVTKQPLPVMSTDSLTPNHTLRRLIQGWCVANATNGVDRIPTPKSTVNKPLIAKLLRDLRASAATTLSAVLSLAGENDRNRRYIAEDGRICAAAAAYVIKCFKESSTDGLPEALRILDLVWHPTAEIKSLTDSSPDLVNALTWILKGNQEMAIKNLALPVLKSVSELLSSSRLELLDLEFFQVLVDLLRNRAALSKNGARWILGVLGAACPWGRNRNKIIEAGAVFELVETELENQERSATERTLCILSQLCSCADGRSEFLGHAGGLAVVAKRTLRVSAATDEWALQIMAAVARFSGTKEVVQEMERAGAVTKVCMVMQADRQAHLKNKAREILRMHYNVWNNSPCIAVYLITRCPR